MSSSWRGNLDERGNKKPKIEELEDVPSSFQRPRPTCYLCDGTDGIPDGGIEDSDASKWEEKGGGKLDPLAVFGSGIMMMILSKLDARSVARSRLVCSDWRSVASSDEIWLPKEEKTSCRFSGKMEASVYCKCVRSYGRERHTYLAYQKFKDFRSWLPICCLSWILNEWEFHFTEVWNPLPLRNWFHFMVFALFLPQHLYEEGKSNRYSLLKVLTMAAFICFHIFLETAPDYWRSLDPHWQGTGTPMRRYFHPDGSITPDSNDRVWGGHESCYTIVTGSLEDGTIRKHYVRINRWPQLSVQRKEDGSWELSNHLYCYTSIPDADKVDGTGPPFPLFS